MLYIGYLIILDGQSFKKKSVSEISIFELVRRENCISRLCPRPLGSFFKSRCLIWVIDRGGEGGV